jgi:hypothetical protein
MNRYESLIKNFHWLLKEISKKGANNFVGIGLVLYNSNYISNIPHCSLRPSISAPEEIRIKSKSTVDFLLEISILSHCLHDGYHFFDERGLLTHVAQYFVPPICEHIVPNELYGTRYLSAQYGSCIKGVIATGVVSLNLKAHCFRGGKAYEL